MAYVPANEGARHDQPRHTGNRPLHHRSIEPRAPNPHRSCLAYNDTAVHVGQREERRIDDMIPAGPSCCWMLTGALRTDSSPGEKEP